MQEYRLQGASRNLPGDADFRGYGAPHHEERYRHRYRRPGAARWDQGSAAVRALQGEARTHVTRGSRGRHQPVGGSAMAAVAKKDAKEAAKMINFAWTGKDKAGKVVKGELRAPGEAAVTTTLRRQGIQVQSVKKVSQRGGKKVTEKDITIFTRQLAVMMKAGVPLLQAFDIVGRGHANPSVGKLLLDIKTDVETGSSLGAAFRKYPRYFDNLFCNLVAAGESAGILDNLLDRLASYKEKILAIKGKIKSALFYPISIVVVALV